MLSIIRLGSLGLLNNNWLTLKLFELTSLLMLLIKQLLLTIYGDNFNKLRDNLLMPKLGLPTLMPKD